MVLAVVSSGLRLSGFATGLSICESSQRASRAKPESESEPEDSAWLPDKLRVKALKLAVHPKRGKARVGCLAGVGESSCVI